MTLFAKKISATAITQWTQHLAMLLDAHLPLTDALYMLANDHENRLLQQLTQHLYQSVLQGTPFSHALKQFPHYFNNSYCQQVLAAERSGLLAPILQRIALDNKNKEHLRAQIYKAISYPALVLSVGITVFFLLLIWVVPKITHVFIQFQQPLPGFTQCIVSLTEIIRTFGFYVIFLILMIATTIYFAKNYSENVSIILAKCQWRFPGVGVLMQITHCIGLAQTLSHLLQAGIPLSTAFPMSYHTLKNLYARQQLQITSILINQGHSLNFALQQTGLFPALALHMWKIGEQSGMLIDMLNESAEFYRTKLNDMTDRYQRLLEPTLLLILGILIGGVVISLYLPLFNIGLMLG